MNTKTKYTFAVITMRKYFMKTTTKYTFAVIMLYGSMILSEPNAKDFIPGKAALDSMEKNIEKNNKKKKKKKTSDKILNFLKNGKA
jgi:hypothetical protein